MIQTNKQTKKRNGMENKPVVRTYIDEMSKACCRRVKNECDRFGAIGTKRKICRCTGDIQYTS